jgi:hypothetical protein
VISNIIRKVEVRLEDGITEIPAHNYHVCLFFSSLLTSFFDHPSIDHDHDAKETSEYLLQTQEVRLEDGLHFL